MVKTGRKRYAIWPALNVAEDDYELTNEAYRVFEVIPSVGRPTELVVGDGCEEPESDCLILQRKKELAVCDCLAMLRARS
jgi:hypothetical protein